jgi:hypothetical protein
MQVGLTFFPFFFLKKKEKEKKKKKKKKKQFVKYLKKQLERERDKRARFAI